MTQNHDELARRVMRALQKEGWEAQLAPHGSKGYDIKLKRGGERVAAIVKDYRVKVHSGLVDKYRDFINEARERDEFGRGFFISTSGFYEPALVQNLSEEFTYIELATFKRGKLRWEDKFEADENGEPRNRFIGVFTAKGGVGKTTVAAHLAGAFALSGYDVILLDLDPQQNMTKLLGKGVYIPGTRGRAGSAIGVLKPDNYEDVSEKDNIIICDCNPEFDENPKSFIRKFDYCIVPTTLTPLGVNKNADVIVRTMREIRRENPRAELFVVINSLYPGEDERNQKLNEAMKASLKELIDDEHTRLNYIEPDEAAIRWSKHLLYWGYHFIENTQPQLAFREIAGRNNPRTDFLKLLERLEHHTDIERLKELERDES